MRWLREHWLQVVVHVGALLPLVWLVWSFWRGLYSIDPVRQSTTLTGRSALVLLLLSLGCTPLASVIGQAAVLKVRRALGLYAFLYAGVHLLIFIGLDYGFEWRLVGPALLQRFVMPGLAALVLLSALAITSTRGWQMRLGRAWTWLHRLAYLAGALVVAHVMASKKDWREALAPAVVLAVLLVLRVPPLRRAIVTARRRLCALAGPGRTTGEERDR